jgi:isocitrate/isopropylmalate dehydrogenase
MPFAFSTALSLPHKCLSMVTKPNVQRHSMVLRDNIICEITKMP